MVTVTLALIQMDPVTYFQRIRQLTNEELEELKTELFDKESTLLGKIGPDASVSVVSGGEEGN